LLLCAYYITLHMATPKGKIAKLQQKLAIRNFGPITITYLPLVG
jgi:hypothetical protein